jgi:hypothetical protein
MALERRFIKKKKIKKNKEKEKKERKKKKSGHVRNIIRENKRVRVREAEVTVCDMYVMMII